MPRDAMPIQTMTELFEKQPCWMIQPLADAMHYSIPSVRRFLAEAEYFSSFTHNGRWYTLRRIPRFNRDGLWFHQNIGFSRAGSLTNTIIALIGRSPAGMSAEQLGTKLGCRCHSILIQLCRRQRLQRRKSGARHVYLAAEAETARQQLRTLVGREPVEVDLPAQIAVLILAEFIKTPKAGFQQLAQSVSRRRNITVTARQIERLFEEYGLKKTTKTDPLTP